VKYLVADSGVEGLFWLVMAIVWVVVQIISRAAKQQRGRASPAQPRPPPGPTQPDTSLEDFLRSLGAETALPPTPVAEPESAPAAAAPALSVRTRKRKAPRPLAPPPPAVMPTVGAEPVPTPWREVPPPEAQIQPALRKIRGMMVIPRIPIVHTPGLRIPGLAFRGDTATTLRRGRGRLSIKNREALRHAMLYRLVLEPPHAFKY
jgi:hypothetical protein